MILGSTPAFHSRNGRSMLQYCSMKIKEGIVYSKSDSRIVGFVNFGTTNNELLSFEHILMFMVRGILKFPYAQYATADLSADLLYPMVWEVIRSLESSRFKVVSLTADKASINRTFFRMNKSTKGHSKPFI